MNHFVFVAVALSLASGRLAAAPPPGPRTFDGKHPIQRIHVTAVYFLPRGRRPLPDWQARVTYYARRLEAFHARESGGRSVLRVSVEPAPLQVALTPEQLRQNDDQNGIFWRTYEAAKKTLAWPRRGGADKDAFPILLVLSDINWRELDDFSRTRIVNGVPTHEGNVDKSGRHFPGAESGGARAVYFANEGFGYGLVSADGWRVPYSGSDCVVYHEGIGHAIGLPHPEPGDDSVMGTAQYRYWLNQSWLNAAQKQRLGFPDTAGARTPNDLFSAFTALPDPIAPVPGQPFVLRFTWPPNAAPVKNLVVETQTDLFGPWKACPVALTKLPPATIAFAFSRPTPVSYRVRVTLADSQTAELWGYFQVRAAAATDNEGN